MEQYFAIVIDPVTASRMNLKTASAAVSIFSGVAQSADFTQAMEKLKAEEKCDLVFISSSFPTDEVKGFITAAKETPQGRDTAYVLTLKAKDQDSSTVATSVMYGADGFLFEPYSVDNLVEATRLAARVKNDRSLMRQRAALGLMVKEAGGHVDQIAFHRSTSADSGPAIKKLQDIRSTLDGMKPEMLDGFYSSLIEVFENAKVPWFHKKEKVYRGASRRVKKRQGEKIAATTLQGNPPPDAPLPSDKKEEP